MWGYDITVTGSLVGGADTSELAKREAAQVSKVMIGRLVRVHDVDGETVIAEYRDGKALELV